MRKSDALRLGTLENFRLIRGIPMPTFADAGRAIEQNLEILRKPGILAVRPGYRIEGGWPVGDPVIVALVGAQEGRGRQLRSADRARRRPGRSARSLATGPHEGDPAGDLPGAAGTRPHRAALARFSVRACLCRTPRKPSPAAARRGRARTEIPYGPAAARARSDDRHATVICNASPDAGWPTLQRVSRADAAEADRRDVRFHLGARSGRRSKMR